MCDTWLLAGVGIIIEFDTLLLALECKGFIFLTLFVSITFIRLTLVWVDAGRQTIKSR